MNSSPVLIREFDVEIADLPAGLDGLRIAHISDFHYRQWNRVMQCAFDHLGEMEYDLLLVTGDFGTSLRKWKHTVEFIHKFFDPLAIRGPIYASLGNHDHPDLATADNLPIHFLVNESISLNINNALLEICGVAQSPYAHENLLSALPHPDTAEYPSDITILLAHYPSTIYRLPPGRVQLQLSGHTHGGQICFPLVGCIWPHDKIPRQMARGLHRIDDTYLHVSAGIGVAPPIFLRILCPPEITVIKMNSQN